MDNENPIVNMRTELLASFMAAAEAAHLPLNVAHLHNLVNNVDVSALFMSFSREANRAFLLPPPPPPAVPPPVPPQVPGLPYVPADHPFPGLHAPPYLPHVMQAKRALISQEVENSYWEFNLRNCIIFFDLIGRWTDVNGRKILWANVSGEIWYRHLKAVDGHRLRTFFFDLIRRPNEERIINNAGPGIYYAANSPVHEFFVATANGMWQARSEGQDYLLAWPANWAGLI